MRDRVGSYGATNSAVEDKRLRVLHNRRARSGAAHGVAWSAVLDAGGSNAAYRTISGWPGYAPTPLYDLPGIAGAARVGRVLYKDESQRFGLGSFKALGGAYAVSRLLAREVAGRTGDPAGSTEQLLAGDHRDIAAGMTVCCATDGNHGRSVAWGARTHGCRCVIFIHATVSEQRKRAIEELGAHVVRISGNYDDAIRAAQQHADANGWFVVSDTSYPGYMDIPRDVMQGYTVMAAEAIRRLPGGKPPTHVFVQAGVGGLAAAVYTCLWQAYGAARPRFILVEPERAACWFESLAAGHPVGVGGDLDTVMAGLACGEVSALAWEILATGADDAMIVSDAAAEDCMRLLADARYGDRPLVAGESAVAGLAALLGLAAENELRQRLDLCPTSRVLLFGTEGATDPEIYERIVGRRAERVGGG